MQEMAQLVTFQKTKVIVSNVNQVSLVEVNYTKCVFLEK
jgi:hypothetical protein